MTSTIDRHGVDSTIDAAANGFRPVPKDQPQPGASLGELAAFFLAKPSPIAVGADARRRGGTGDVIGRPLRRGWWSRSE